MTKAEYAAIKEALSDAKDKLEMLPQGRNPALDAMCCLGLALELLADATWRLSKR